MADPEWKPGLACEGRHLLIDFYRKTAKSIPRVNGMRCAPMQFQAGMSSVMIGCDKHKCPLLGGQADETLTEQTEFVLERTNTQNRNMTSLQLQWNQFPSFRAGGVVEVQGTIITAQYLLPECMRRKIPRKGENYRIT